MPTANNALAETYRSVVAPWECDVMGHLTIANYFDRFTDAAFALVERLSPGGAPPAAVWRTTEIFARYQRELRAGDGFFIRSGVIGGERGGEPDGAVRIGHELVTAEGGEVASLVEHRLALRDLPYGGMAERRGRLVAAAVPWSMPPFDEVPPLRREPSLATGRDRIKASEVDERGELLLSGYVHRFSFACLQLCSAFGLTPSYMRAEQRGFSTFETRLHLLAPPPGAGDGVVLTSGVLGAGNASIRLRHELRASASGALLAAFYQAGVHFDIEARRSAPWPAALRERAMALAID